MEPWELKTFIMEFDAQINEMDDVNEVMEDITSHMEKVATNIKIEPVTVFGTEFSRLVVGLGGYGGKAVAYRKVTNFKQIGDEISFRTKISYYGKFVEVPVNCRGVVLMSVGVPGSTGADE